MTAIDVDADIVDHARERLAVAGVANVEVVLGDGALGHQRGASYDRIIATVGAYGVTDAWLTQLTQLTPTGRRVVPRESAEACPARSPSSAVSMVSGAVWTTRCAASLSSHPLDSSQSARTSTPRPLGQGSR